MRDYSTLTREELELRCGAAEDALTLYSWSPVNNSTRGKATLELWLRWLELPGTSCTPEDNPHLTDAVIAQLANERDMTVQDLFRNLQPAV